MEFICLALAIIITQTHPFATYIAILEKNILTDQFSGMCLRCENVWASMPKSFIEENSGEDNQRKSKADFMKNSNYTLVLTCVFKYQQ